MNKIIWKDIKDYEGRYKISTNGEVFSIVSNIKMNLIPNERGYLGVTLFKDGKQSTKKVHRLVAQTFIENPLNKPEVNHIDKNTSNNNINNLEWCTRKENATHLIMNKNSPDKIRDRLKIIHSGNSKLIDDENSKIVQLNGRTYELMNTFDNVFKATSEMNLKDYTAIKKVCIGINLLSCKSRWMYLEDYLNYFNENINVEIDIPETEEIISDVRIKYIDEISNINMINKPVYQLDLYTDEILNEFDSIKAASKYLKVNDSDISAVCKGKRKQIKGFKFIYKYSDSYTLDYINEKTKNINQRNKPIYQVKLGAIEIINEFKSAKEAIEKLNLNVRVKNINKTCRGENKTCAGFDWYYKENFPNKLKDKKIN